MKIPENYLDLLDLKVDPSLLVPNDIQEKFDELMHNTVFHLALESFVTQLNLLFDKEAPSKFSLLQGLKKKVIKVEPEGLYLFYKNPNLILFPLTGNKEMDANNLVVNADFIKNQLIELAMNYQMHLATKETYLAEVFETVSQVHYPHLTEDVKVYGTSNSVKPKMKIPNPSNLLSAARHRGVEDLELQVDISIGDYRRSSYANKLTVPMHLLDPKNQEELGHCFNRLIKITHSDFQWSARGKVSELVLKIFQTAKSRYYPSSRLEVLISNIGSEMKVRMIEDKLLVTLPLNTTVQQIERVKKFTDMLLFLNEHDFRYLSRLKFTTESTDEENYSFEFGYCSIDIKEKELKQLINEAKIHEEKYNTFVNSGSDQLKFELPTFSPFYLNRKENADGSLVNIQCKDLHSKKSTYLFFVNGVKVSSNFYFKAQRRYYKKK